MYASVKLLPLLVFALWSQMTLADSHSASTLQESMGQQQFEKAGLHKLTPEELAALEQWIGGRSVPPQAAIKPVAPVPATAVTVAKEPQPAITKPGVAAKPQEEFGLQKTRNRQAVNSITSRIDGEFTGWTGKTIFELENGQVWIQRLRGKSHTRLSSPEVIISRNMLGYYKMTIVETGRSVGVKRIK